jgi:glycosyltransferase involved in cell wall biosynthesis
LATFLHPLFSASLSILFAAAIAILLLVIVIVSRRHQLSLPEIRRREASEAPPDCMVVIPARDEQRMIERVVKSLPRDSVIVVNDASADRTAERAKAAGAGVVDAPKLLRGMLGKPNACAEGARLLTSRWILFADADTWFRPEFLDSAIAAAEAAKVDFLSIYLGPAYESLGARVVGPYATALYFFGLNPRTNAANAFNGQCILVKREPYEFVGGHGAIRQHLNEDTRLAGLALRHRMVIGLARTHKLGRVRIDPESFKRDAHRVGMIGLWTGVKIMLAALLFFSWLPVDVWLLLSRHEILAGAFLLWPMILLSPWYGAMALLAPLGIVFLTPRLLGLAVHTLTGRRVEWKGRTI